MMSKYTSLFMAALLLAGTVAFAAEDNLPPGPPPGPMPRHHSRLRTPDFREGRRDGRDGPRDNRRCDRRDDRRGPRGPGGEWGERGMGMGMMGMGPGMGFGFGDAIELTADQKAKLVDTMTANFRAGLIARMSHQEAARALRKLKGDETADAQAIIDANTALGKAQGEMQVARRKFREDMQNILTDEQKQTLKETREEFTKKIRERFGDRGEGGKMRRPMMPPPPPGPARDRR